MLIRDANAITASLLSLIVGAANVYNNVTTRYIERYYYLATQIMKLFVHECVVGDVLFANETPA